MGIIYFRRLVFSKTTTFGHTLGHSADLIHEKGVSTPIFLRECAADFPLAHDYAESGEVRILLHLRLIGPEARQQSSYCLRRCVLRYRRGRYILSLLVSEFGMAQIGLPLAAVDHHS